jgi:SAM-dependent methyltransferase
MKSAHELLGEVAGFQRSRAVLSGAELDLFSRLAASARPASELAAEIGANERALARLLDCLVTFDLLAKEGDRYRVTESGALLSSGHPESVLPMVLHQNALWRNWSLLTETVRHGRNPRLEELRASRNEAERAAFILAMHVVGRGLAGKIVADLDVSGHRRLLDIGGASGTYTLAFLRRNPGMTAILYDLEHAIPLARERFEREGLLDRVELVAGDFYRDELPRGADLALLSAIIHQNSPEEDLALYRKIHRALEPGGELLIRDYFMDASRTSPPRGALFALNMLVCTPGGDTHTLEEVRDRLHAAGFAEVRQVRRGDWMDAVVSARKPG